jgi:3-isopropylmalate/(R)-2-methylmalate dehydratase large subunit
MAEPKTLFDKIWDAHVIAEREDGQTLLYVDRHLATEGISKALKRLAARDLPMLRPDQTFAVPDHYSPTDTRTVAEIADPEARGLVEQLAVNAATYGFTHFAMDDIRMGIVHVVGPELGITQPGIVLLVGDSHTATHGALGAIAFGIGSSEVGHVLATQSLWQRKPKTMRVTVDGTLGFGVTGKDVILAIIARIGADGGVGHAIEYAGPGIRQLSMEGRMTVSNMSIEGGARIGLIAPDDKTIDYLKGRPYAPEGAMWDKAVAHWRSLKSDDGAAFDQEVTVDGDAIAPMATWGNSPQDAAPVTGHVPDPDKEPDTERRAAMARALDYMDLKPGMAMTDIAVDRVFIGSCTNSRIEDMRAAAAVAKGRKAVIPAMVVPGSGQVKAAAEAEGLDRIFREAGFDWRYAGCSMCVGVNGDLLEAGQRSASTNNRNFRGRQGRGSRTHLVSPAMAAAAAVTGRLTDVRTLMEER